MNNNSNDMQEIMSRLNSIHISNKQEIKFKIKEIFDKCVKNKKFNKNEKKHHGEEGMMIESLFTKNTNSNTHADFYGYEIKKSANKISFGDWSADEYIFNQKDYLDKLNLGVELNNFNKKQFLELFGNYNYEKNRNSWSGKVCPSYYNKWTYSGQILTIDDKNNIYILYSYSKDSRNNLKENIPNSIKNKKFIVLAFWSFSSIETKVSRKFNNIGTVIVNKNKENIYDKIIFCKSITPLLFIEKIKECIIFFDSGMYEGNSRNYSQFRANKSFWLSITEEEY